MDILFLADVADGVCATKAMGAIMSGAKLILFIIRVLVPIALIVLGSIDLAKAVIAGDEKKIKEAQKPFVRRVIAAVIVFLVPWIVDVLMGLLSNNDYATCWENRSGTLSEFQCFIDQGKKASDCK